MCPPKGFDYENYAAAPRNSLDVVVWVLCAALFGIIAALLAIACEAI